MTSVTNFDLSNLIQDALTPSTNSAVIAEKFLADSSIAKYAIGRNEDTLRVHQFVSITAIIDDYFTEQTWNDIPVIKLNQVPDGAIILNASTSISPVNVQRLLVKQTKTHVVSLCDLIQASRGKIPWPQFVQEQRDEIAHHLSSWQTLHDCLADRESQKTLRDILCYRLTANSTYMEDYKVRIEEQYFEPFMDYRNEVFVDAGGFDGDTTEAFVKRYSDYRKVILFEPSKLNMDAAQIRLKGLRDIEFRCVGLSDAAETLSFDADSGSASSVQHQASNKIDVDKLDSLVSEPVTFIKMDLEGWEMKALLGASQHLKLDKPKLALAVYHHASDPRVIFEYINSFNHGYKVYLRHYTQGWSESVMFFR